MATKNLARTILEAGKLETNKVEREEFTRKERAQERKYLSRLKYDPEFADAVPAPRRKKAWKLQGDKLGAVYKFLDSWVGKSWNRAYSEMKKKFNPRSLPGYHIMHDHVMRDVHPNEDSLRHRYGGHWHDAYWVDDNGILRKKPKKHRGKFALGPVISWLSNRRIGKLGKNYYWFVNRRNSIKWRYLLEMDNVYKEEGLIEGFQPTTQCGDRIIPVHMSFRQDRHLTAKEREYFEELPFWLKEEIMKQSTEEIKKRKNEYWIEQKRKKVEQLDDFKYDKMMRRERNGI